MYLWNTCAQKNDQLVFPVPKVRIFLPMYKKTQEILKWSKDICKIHYSRATKCFYFVTSHCCLFFWLWMCSSKTSRSHSHHWCGGEGARTVPCSCGSHICCLPGGSYDKWETPLESTPWWWSWIKATGLLCHQNKKMKCTLLVQRARQQINLLLIIRTVEQISTLKKKSVRVHHRFWCTFARWKKVI